MKKSWVIFICNVILSLHFNAQEFHFETFGMNEGLPQAEARNLFVDSQGYIWVSNQKGVARFDGKNFKTFGKKNGLKNQLVNCVFETNDHRFLVGTRQGLYFLNETKTTFPELLTENISSISNSSKGIYVNGNSDREIYISKQKINIDTYSSADLITIQNYKGKDYLLYSDSLVTPNRTIFFDEFGIKGIEFIILSEDEIWVTTKSGILIIKGSMKTMLPESIRFPFSSISSIVQSRDNQIWLGSYTNGIAEVNPVTLKITVYDKEQGLKNTSVLDLAIDYQDNVWIGGRSGLTVLKRKSPFLQHKQSQGLPEELILGISKGINERIEVCTYGDGVYYKSDSIFQKMQISESFPAVAFFSSYTDAKDRTWYSTRSNGAIAVKDNEIIPITNKHLIEELKVFSVAESKDGVIWICTQSNGLFKVKNDTLFEVDDANYYKSTMCALAEAEDLWIGSIDGGLWRMRDNVFSKDTAWAKEAKYVRQMLIDVNGYVWIGTGSNGVYSFKHGKQVAHITEENGLNSNNIYVLFADSKNQIWAGTEKGLNRISVSLDGQPSQIKIYGKDDGFTGLETNVFGAEEDLEGHIWFSSDGGIAEYLPEKDTSQIELPLVHFENMELFYKPFNYTDYEVELDPNLFPKTIRLPYYQNHLTVKFNGIHYSHRERLKFRFKSNPDEPWSPPTKTDYITYNNLSNGTYMFEVQASIDNVAWTDSKKINITITPPFWKETWFILLTVLVSLTGLFLFYKWRIRKLEKDKEFLEKTVEERTEEIRLQKGEIEQQNQEIEEKNESILASIAYAEHIQLAMLPTPESVNNVLSDYFILFKPRDIVSGDFYWIDEVDGKKIIIAADCTGHGVPGAFMSLIGNNHLTDIIIGKKITRPDLILTELNRRIIDSLKQDKIESQDGMDINITVLDGEFLYFASAYNPLVYIDNDGEVHKVVGDYVSLGGSRHQEDLKFTLHKFLRKDIKCYFQYSDGIIDQFGGKKGKKFMYKRVSVLLQENSHLPMSDQKERIESAFINWKKDEDQIDDVILIGVNPNA